MKKLLLCVLLAGAVALAAGPKPLFNGKDLKGWARIPRHEGAPAGEKPGFVVRDGLLVSLPDAPEDDLCIEVQIDETGDEWHSTGVFYSMTRARRAPTSRRASGTGSILR